MTQSCPVSACRPHHFLSVIILSAFLATRIFGQSIEVDRADLVRNQPGLPTGQYPSESGVTNGQIVSSPNDPDLGEQQILKKSDEYQPFTASASVPFYYTTNAALASTDEEDDLLVAPVVAISYDPRIGKSFFGHFAVRQQFFFYDRFHDLNFASFDADVGFSYSLAQFHNLILRAQYEYERLTDTDDFEEFFSNHALIVNAEMPFRLNRAQQFSVGVDANFSIAGEPDSPRRNDYSVYVVYSINVTRALSVSASGRIAVRDYVPGDRTDISETLALSANYRVTNWLTASAISSFSANQSNHSVFDYEVANIGGAASLAIKW